LIVSGFFTSPCDHSMICSGLAREIRMAEKLNGSFGFSKKLKMSFIIYLPASSLDLVLGLDLLPRLLEFHVEA
jgi:hypothetical protein